MEPREGACSSIIEAFALYEGLVRHAIADHDTGLSKTQEMTLIVLHVAGSLNVSRIAEWLAVSREQASRTIGGLEEKGLVEKVRGRNNRRIVNIGLTEQGENLARKMHDTALRNISADLEVLDDAELTRLAAHSNEAASVLKTAAGRLTKEN